MKRFGIALLCTLCGYTVTAFGGYWLIEWFSPNTHDRSLEAAMTSAFVIGPIGALAGLVVGFVLGRRRSTEVPSQ